MYTGCSSWFVGSIAASLSTAMVELSKVNLFVIDYVVEKEWSFEQFPEQFVSDMKFGQSFSEKGIYWTIGFIYCWGCENGEHWG